MFAALFACAMISGVSPAYGVEEMTCAPKAANAKLQIMLPGSIAVTVVAMERVGASKERIFLLEGYVAGFKNVQELVAVGRGYGDVVQVGVPEIPHGKKD